MKLNQCEIVVMRQFKKMERDVARFRAEVADDGSQATVWFIATGFGELFVTREGKPAVRSAMEAVMLKVKGYDPRCDRVTVMKEELGPEGF